MKLGKIREVTYFASENKECLRNWVNKAIKDGWQPFGYLAFDNHSGEYIQMLVKVKGGKKK